MVACLFWLSTTEQQANSNNFTNTNTSTNNIEEPNPLYQGSGDILCDEFELFELPPIFGIGGITVGVGTGCGENSDLDCVGAMAFIGGKLIVTIECTPSQ